MKIWPKEAWLRSKLFVRYYCMDIIKHWCICLIVVDRYLLRLFTVKFLLQYIACNSHFGLPSRIKPAFGERRNGINYSSEYIHVLVSSYVCEPFIRAQLLYIIYDHGCNPVDPDYGDLIFLSSLNWCSKRNWLEYFHIIGTTAVSSETENLFSALGFSPIAHSLQHMPGFCLLRGYKSLICKLNHFSAAKGPNILRSSRVLFLNEDPLIWRKLLWPHSAGGLPNEGNLHWKWLPNAVRKS